jgi:ligand-binding sensor domain-containing protein/serine phosphatase RsbU (regulator of sigma subunit)
MIRLTAGLIVFFAGISIIYSQANRLRFNNLSLDDGLSQSTVYSILKDSRGFIWFGSLDGLNKYNGYEIVSYRKDVSDENSIADNYIKCLFEDNSQNLWIGTHNGISVYNRITNSFINPQDKNISNSSVTEIVQKDKDHLWFATDNGIIEWEISDDIKKESFSKKVFNNTSEGLDTAIIGIEKFGSGEFIIASVNKLFIYNSTSDNVEEIKLSSDNSIIEINDVFIDYYDDIYIATKQGLFIYYNNGKLNHFENKENATSISHNDVTAMCEGDSTTLWLGTRGGGLNRFDKTTKTFYSYRNESTDFTSLSVDNIETVYLDNSDILWVGTSLGGVDMTHSANDGWVLYKNNPLDPLGLNADQVRCFYQDKKENFWVGTVDGGLFYWDKENDDFYDFKFDENDSTSISHNHVRDILEDSNNNFWIATDGGGLNLFDREKKRFKHFKHDEKNSKSISCNRIWNLLEDHNGNIWMATYGGGLNKLNLSDTSFIAFRYNETDKNSISGDSITYLFEDHLNNLWVGTFGRGLNLFNVEDELFEVFYADDKNPESISNNRIYSVVEDEENNLWIGTKGGLNKYNRNSKSFKVYKESDGLPNDVIMGILDDGLGSLWLSTNIGLAKFEKDSETFKNFDEKDGLQSNEFLVNSFMKAKDGVLLFGGIKGFNAFYPEDITDNQFKPPVVFTNFQLFYKDVELDTSIAEKKILRLDYDDEIFSFEVAALNYISPEKNQYRYMLVNFDDDWNYIGTRRYITFTNIPPGNYTLLVEGSNNDGEWCEVPASIQIIIEPPWWQRLWFQVSVVVLTVFLIALFIVLRERKLKREKRILEEKVRERTTEIRQKNLEIEAQRDKVLEQNELILQSKEEIEAQRDEIEEQKDLLERQFDEISIQKKEIEHINEELTDSIHYAKRIQAAILPTKQLAKKLLPKHFVLFKPKDIVSGDFYWMTSVEGKSIIATADCTGHGVPGAFMSMLGAAFLNEIVNKEYIAHPGVILRKLRKEVIEALQQKGEAGEQKDGMDMTLCAFSADKKTLEYAGANNPIYIIRNKNLPEIVHNKKLEHNDLVLYEIKGDNMPIAIFERMDRFVTHEIELLEGDQVYMFTDGFADQFGGPKGKKFKYKPFKLKILENCHKPLEEQREILFNTIVDWMDNIDPLTGSLVEQVDDITVIGIRI